MPNATQLLIAERLKKITPYRWTARAYLVVGCSLGAAHLVLGIAAVALTGLAAAKPPFLGLHADEFAKNLAYFGASCTAVLTFLNAGDASRRYLAGQRHLQDMINRFGNESTFTLNDVIRAREEAASLIHEGKALPPNPGP